MTFGIIIKAIGTLIELLLPYILAIIIDEVIPVEDTNLIMIYGGVMLCLAVLAYWANIFANRHASKISNNIIVRIRNDLFAKTLSLSSNQIDRFTISSLESRITSDTYNVHRMLTMMQRIGIRGPILLLGGITISFIMEPVLALIMIATLPFIILLTYFRAKGSIPLYEGVQKEQDAMVAIVRENIQGIRIIKALVKHAYETDRYHHANENLATTETNVGVKMAIINPLMNLFMNIGLVLVIIVGAYRVNDGLSEAGKIIAFVSYFTIIANAMLSVSRIFVMYSKGIASANRLMEVLRTPVDAVNLNQALHVSPSDGTVLEFRKVSFSYFGKKNNVADISFSLRKGETLGILGATGSGKTTLIQLMLRLYDPDSGSISVFGQEIKAFDIQELRNHFGVVMQKDFIFQGTIRDNIAFGRDLSEDAIHAAVGYAQARNFIDSKEGGLYYRLASKGANVSGGQRQRIFLSRALAHHPDILLLDDASSALDYQTDASFRKALRQHYRDTTKVVVAQRIASIIHADHIILLDDGKIVAEGSHRELLEHNDLYASIYETQMGGMSDA